MSKKRLVGAVCVFATVLAIAYLAMIHGMPEKVDRLRLHEVALIDEYANKKKYAVNLDLYRDQLREIDRTFGVLLHALPDRFEHSIEDVVVAIGRHRLRAQSFQVYGWETMRDWHAERAVRLELTGRYHDLAAFLAETTAFAGMLRVDVLRMDRVDGGNVRLVGDLRMYRYLSDAETAAKVRSKAGQSAIVDSHAMRLLLSCLAADCAPEPADLLQELRKRTKDLRGRIDLLPGFKPSPVVTYERRNLADPFHPPTTEQ